MRQREGIAKTKAENRYLAFGAAHKADEAVKLFREGRHGDANRDVHSASDEGASNYRALETCGIK